MRIITRKTAFALGIALGICGLARTSHAQGSTTSVTMTPQLVHQGETHTNVVVSANGRQLAALHRGTIHLWDVESGALLRTLSPTGAPKFAFTNDNEHLRYVTTSIVNGKPTLITGDWNLVTGESSEHLGPPGIFVSIVAPGALRAILGENPRGTIHVYDLENHKIIRTFGTPPPTGTPSNQLDPRTISIMAVPKDGLSVLLTRVNGSIECWDTENSKQRFVFKSNTMANWLALSADGFRSAYTGSGENPGSFGIHIVDVMTGKRLQSLPLKTNVGGGTALSSDGKRALGIAANGSFRIWDTDSGREIQTGQLEDSRGMATVEFLGNDQIVWSGPNRLERWNITKGTKLQSFVADKSPVIAMTSAGLTPTLDRVIVAGAEGSAMQLFSWDLTNLGLHSTHRLPSVGVKIAATGSVAWIPTSTGFDILNLKTFQSRNIMRDSGTMFGGTFAISGNGQKLVAPGQRRGSDPMTNQTWPEIVLTEWDANSGAKIDKIVRKRSDLNQTVLTSSQEGRFVVTNDQELSSLRRNVRLWDLERDTLVFSTDMTRASYVVAAVSPNGQTLALAFMEQSKPGSHTIQVIDIPSGKVRTSMTSSIVGLAQAMVFSPAGDKLALGSVTIEVFQTMTGALAHSFRGDPQWITSLAFAADGKYLLASGQGGTTKMYRLDKPASVTLMTSAEEWLVYDDDGYFDASRKGGTLVAATEGLRAYRIDQLAVRNNRPDLLLERMGLGDTDTIAHFRARYRKRLEKLGISDDAALPTFRTTPEVTISQVDMDGATAIVKFEAKARGADLLRYNIFVNNVPIFGTLGKTTSGKDQRFEERIELGSGKNKIEVSALNARGGESLRAVRVIERKEASKGDLYYLAFGVSKYQNSKYNLGYPHKDVSDLGDVLVASAGKTFAQVHVRTYINEKATVENIRKAKDFFAQTKEDDTVVLFIAGHGLHARDSAADYYFATHEIDPKRLADTAARFDLVEDLLQGIRSRKKLFLMDTCESGESDKDDVPLAGLPETSRSLVARSARQLEFDIAYASGPRVAATSKRKYYDRERYIYNDLTRRTGAIVISSSRGSEFSYELPEIANGVFTEEILLALTTDRADRDHDGAISTDELRRHLADEVPKRTQDRQHPTVDRDNLDARFGFPIVKAAANIVDRQTLPTAETGPAENMSNGGEKPPFVTRPRGCACDVTHERDGALWAFVTTFVMTMMLRRRKTRLS